MLPCAFALALFVAARAHAQPDADEVALTLEAGYAGVPSFAGPARGLDLQLGASFGLGHGLGIGPQLRTDWFATRPTSARLGLELPVAYAIDVLVVIPWIALGPALSLTPSDASLQLGVTASLGLDYRPRPRWSIGAAFDGSFYLPDPLHGDARTAATLRVTYYVSRVRYDR